MNKKTFSKTVCRVLFFSVFFFFLFIKADFVSAFSCSSGTLDTTCYVNNVQAISNGETISGTRNLII